MPSVRANGSEISKKNGNGQTKRTDNEKCNIEEENKASLIRVNVSEL